MKTEILVLLATSLQASLIPADTRDVPIIPVSAEFYLDWTATGLIEYVVLPPGVENLLVPCLPDLSCIPLIAGRIADVPDSPEPGTWILAGVGLAIALFRRRTV